MTLEDLRRAVEALPPGTGLTLSREALLEALDGAGLDPGHQDAAPDHLLTAKAVAERLGVSKRWCYEHAMEIGVKRLSRRCVRFSAAAVARYQARRR